MSFLQRTGCRFAASAVMVACFAASSAFAAMLATNDFETSFADFTTDSAEALSDLVSLPEYSGNKPSGSYTTEPYPFVEANFGSHYLSVDADTNMVWRTFASRTSSVYFDSYVQFTAMQGDFEYPTDSKFVIYLDSATSNLCVISGTAADNCTAVTNRLTATVEPNSWGRLTVNVLSGSVFSFQVRLNGNLLSTSGSVSTFYSLTTGTTLSQVGFSGTGALDDMVVRTTDPFGTAVATINGEGYASLQQAAAEAVAGDTILLETASSENITLSVAGIVFNTNGKNYTGTVSAASGLGWTEENGVYTSSANTAATWTGSVDNNWSNAGNWSSHGVPTAATTVTLTDGATIEATGTSALPVDSMIVNGSVKLTCTGVLADNWPSIGIKGSVSGTGTLTLERFGLISSDDDQVTVGCNISFDGKTADSFLQDGTFVVNGSVTVTNTVQLYANTTFNGAVTIPDGATMIFKAKPTFGTDSSLSGTGVFLLSGDIDTTDTFKNALQSPSWTGTCEIYNNTINAYDLSEYGNENSVVRANILYGYPKLDNATARISGIKALEIATGGLKFQDSFAGVNVYIDVPVTGNGPIYFKTRQNVSSASSLTKFIFTKDMSQFTGTLDLTGVSASANDYRKPIVVFQGAGDVLPVPTVCDQIVVTENANVTAAGTWKAPGGIVVNGTINVVSGGKLTTSSGLSSTGKVVFASMPASEDLPAIADGTQTYEVSGNSYTISATVPAWTGTVVLDYANVVANHADFSARVNALGTSNSTVEIGENGTIVDGYSNANITPTLKVTGSVQVNDGSSGTKRKFAKVTGSGKFEFGTRGAMVNYAIDNLVDWNGTMTVGSSKASVTNIVSGTGSIVFNVMPDDRPMVGSGYTGEIEVAFNWQNVDLSAYSGDNATLVLDSMTGYFAENNGGENGIRGKTVVDGTVLINNGWPKGSGNFWTDNRCVKFSTLEVAGSLSLIYPTSTGWQNLWGYVSATALDGDSTGSITVGNNFFLKVNAVDFDEAPSGTERLVSLALTGENDANGYSHKGRLYGPNGASGEAIPVTVGGIATGQMLVYATTGGNSGLYLAVAQYGGNYYATFQDAINARGSGAGDITVLDASAPIPFGYKVSDGKLIRNRKIIFEFR